MHFQIDLNTVLQSLAIVGIVAILKQVWTMNGSMREMKVWQAEHEKSDERRFQALETWRD